MSIIIIILSKCLKFAMFVVVVIRVAVVIKCNLTELALKSGCVPSRACRIVMHMYPCIHLYQSSFMLNGVCQCMRGASIGKPVQSAVFCCANVDPSCLLYGCSMFRQKVSRLFPTSTLHLLTLYRNIL